MRILAIGSHLDDIELACGGTLATAISNGNEVLAVVMSESDYTNYDGTVMRSKEQAIREGTAALRTLAVKNIEILKFPTKDVPYDSTSVEAINRYVTSFNPDLIFTHWTHDTHQAHRNTSLASISAARNKESIFMYEPFPPSGRSYHAFRPQVYIDISSKIDTKVASLKAHESQYQKYGENWIDATIARARLRGYECNCKYAEVFELVRYKLAI